MAHLVQNNIGGTVRAMVKLLFSDNLLQEYSFKGQKNKKAFSSLYSCSLIFGKKKKKMNILCYFLLVKLKIFIFFRFVLKT